MKSTSIIFGFFLATAVVLAAADQHLFILSGQSNMAGLKPEVSFTPAVEKEFGKENVTIVKVAQNGAPIRTWYKDYQFPDGHPNKGRKETFGNNYLRLMEAVGPAAAGKSFDTVTFIWMQGERDAKESLSEVYAASFHGILKQLKADLKRDKINFVIGRISDFDMQDQRYPHWTKIRKIQQELAENAPNGAWVDTDDLNGGKPGQVGGGLHYSGSGYQKLGQRFAEQAIALIKRGF